MVTYCPWPSVLSRRQKGLATLGRVPVSQMPQGAWLRCERGQQSCPCPRCQQDSAAIPAPPVPPSCSTQGFTRKPGRARQLCREGQKPKQIGAWGCWVFFLSFFFALPAQLPAPPLSSPLECISKFLAGSLHAAAGFASDCLQRLRFSHTRDHGSGSPWLRAGSASPPALAASAGRGEASSGSRRAKRGCALSHT